jgi:hypothetical protein
LDSIGAAGGFAWSCLSTPTTISAWRSTRCLVDAQILYTPELGAASGKIAGDRVPDGHSAHPASNRPRRDHWSEPNCVAND